MALTKNSNPQTRFSQINNLSPRALEALTILGNEGRENPALAGLVRSAYAEMLNSNGSEPDEGGDIESYGELKTWLDLDALIGPVGWDWVSWLPLGLLALIASESGTGKSALMLRLAGCYTKGWPWPDGSPFTGERGAVLWCESEAAQAINLERAKKWGLPLEQIYTPLDNPLEDFKLENSQHYGALIAKSYLPEVRIIMIDSLSGADPRAEKSTEDSTGVLRLAELARDINKPLLVSHHLRKRSIFDGDKVDLDRLRGSSSIVQPARIVWALDVPDLKNGDWKRLQVVKSNLARFPEPVGLSIDDTGVNFGQAPEAPRIETVADRAVDLLLALLQDEPRPAREIESEFDQAGISTATMKRAKSKLGVISIKDREGWKWGLPAREEHVN